MKTIKLDQTTKSFIFCLILCLVENFPAWGVDISAVSRDKLLPIGTGYNSRSQELLGQCLSGVETSDGAQATLNFTQEVSEEVVASQLGFEAGVKARIGVISVNAAAEYFNEARSTNLSLSFNYSSEYLRTVVLKDTAAKILGRLETHLEDPVSWFNKCGDEYVQSRDEGARFMMNMRVDFSSREEKNRFKAGVSVSGGFGEVRANIQRMQNSMNRKNKLTLSVLQLGGDPARLGAIFQSRTGGGDAKQIISCSFGDLTQCLDVMANVLDYATDQQRGFPSQIRNFSNYVTLKLRTKPWRHLVSLGLPNPPPTEWLQSIESSKEGIQDLFEKDYQLWTKASRHLKAKVPRLSQSQEEKMEQLVRGLRENLNQLGRALNQCYETKSRCESILKELEADFAGRNRQWNEDTLAALVAPETYAQFCDLQGSDPKLDRTLEALDQIAFKASGKSRQDWEMEDPCALAERELLKFQQLDLSGKNLQDLRPLSSFRQLVTLHLAHNQLMDLTPLASFHQLVELDLSDNLIADILPLVSLRALQRLNLRGNQLRNVEPLSVLGQLKQVDLTHNQGLVESSFTRQPFCKTQDLSGNAKFTEIHHRSLPFQTCYGMSVCAEGSLSCVLFTGGTTERADQSTWAFFLNPEDQTLSHGEELHVGRSGHSSTLLKDRKSVLLVGGDSMGATFELYSLSEKRRICIAELKSPRVGHTATLLGNGQVVIAGGWKQGLIPAIDRDDATKAIEIFDPQSKTTKLIGRGFSPPRAHHAAVSIGSDRMLFTGGVNGRDVFNHVEFLENQNGEYALVTPRGLRLKVSRFYHTMTALPDGRILIAGGFGADLQALSSVELYDPTEKTCILMDRGMETPRGGHGAVLLEDLWVLFVGGATQYRGGLGSADSDQRALHQAEIFDIKTESFIQVGKLKHPRSFVSLGLFKDDHEGQVFVPPCMGTGQSLRTLEYLDVKDLY